MSPVAYPKRTSLCSSTDDIPDGFVLGANGKGGISVYSTIDPDWIPVGSIGDMMGFTKHKCSYCRRVWNNVQMDCCPGCGAPE